ncbi:MAG: MFS transporter [Clostridiales Family XIII bacterium]|jgi:DHA2 family lincomycin resistance protein-like MFS transporter|nr:MFS transporter [Clostridiales Family XIII bacterium]
MQNIKSPKLIVAVVAFAAFLATFNDTFLNVAFAPIMTDLHVDAATVQWLVTGYMLAAAVMVPVSAFAYRSIATKPLFLCTSGLLIVGGVVGIASNTFLLLLIGRIIQGLAAGMLIPIAMNITLEVAPREKLGTYMGVMGSMISLGPSASIIFAGFLLSFSDWHVLQWIITGLAIVCFLFGAFFLPNVATLTHPKMDAISVAFVSIALIGILYGISTIFTAHFVVAIIGIVIGLVFLILFVTRQTKLEHPLIDLRPLNVRPFKLGVLINMISLITIFAMNIVIPIFMQSVLGVSSFAAALTLFPAIGLCCILSPIAGRIYDKHGARILLPLGFILTCVFSVMVSLFISSGSMLALALLYLPVIGGSAFIIGPVQSLALSHLSPEQNPHGVTILSTGFQIAGCIGTSLLTGVYFKVSTMTAASGASMSEAGRIGFLSAGILTAVFAFVGIVLAIQIGRYSKPASTQHASFKLKDIMKKDVFALSKDDKVADALALFVEKHISGAPIVDSDHKVVGFVSDGDIMRYLSEQHAAFTSPWSIVAERENDDFDSMLKNVMALTLGKIATHHVITVDADSSIGNVCSVLIKHNLRKAPVVENGHMVGVINLSNVSHYSMRAYLDGASA